MVDLLVTDIGQLVVGPETNGPGLETYDDATLAIEDGVVVAAGPTESVTRAYPPANATHTIDADGSLLTPGFVDPHTHALFAGDRSNEFVARIEGKSYTDIMNAGGGISVTVEAVREASDDELLSNLLTQLDVMLAHGTTTAEVKSGYGLDPETECRMLSAIQRADDAHPIDIVPTFMGAHVVPDGWDTDEYVRTVVDEQLPAVADQGIAQFCDVFCEEGVFDVTQSRRVLEAGREVGLEPKIHAEEFSRIGGAQLAAELEATSADHLLQATAEDARALVDAGVTPVLLPATAFSLSEPYAEPDTFLDAGTPVALGTDLNPSCFVHSASFVTSLACLRMGMKPETALRGVTSAAARAIGYAGPDDSNTDGSGADDSNAEGSRTNQKPAGPGTLRVGTAADCVLFDLPTARHVPYNAGTNRVEAVLKDGAVVFDARNTERRNGLVDRRDNHSVYDE